MGWLRVVARREAVRPAGHERSMRASATVCPTQLARPTTI
jgi:hypothetical protein